MSTPILLHTVSSSVMLWGYMQLDTLVDDAWIEQQKGGHWQYLTIQGLAAACLTMLLGLGGDLVPSMTGFRKAQRALLMISLPVSVVVSSIYGTLILFFPALLLPPLPTSEATTSAPLPLMHIPLKIDLALHLSPVLALLVEFAVYQEPYSFPEVTYQATILAILAGTWYGAWAEYCASYNKSFPYPFLTDNPLEVRVCIYAAATVLALLAFMGINSVHPRKRAADHGSKSP